jgi:hypothetical protein
MLDLLFDYLPEILIGSFWLAMLSVMALLVRILSKP